MLCQERHWALTEVVTANQYPIGDDANGPPIIDDAGFLAKQDFTAQRRSLILRTG